MPGEGMDRWTHPAVILVATDLSDLDQLMEIALSDAAETGARLLLLHVLATSTGMAVDPLGMPFYDPAGALEFAAKTLHPWCTLARDRGIACDALVREGNAAQQIATSVRQFNADRILLGTRSRGKVSKLLLGSVAEQVLRSVNLPVITVGPEAHLPVESSGHEKVVLHATTLREASRPSAALACRLAAVKGARLVLLHVLPPISEMKRHGLPTGLESTAMQQLHELAADVVAGEAGSGVVVEPRVAHGNPSIEILAASVELHASLIILGAMHHSALQNLTRDHTIYRILAHARCPVLTMREPLVAATPSYVERLSVHR